MPNHDSSILMMVFLLRSIFKNSKAKRYLRMRFQTELVLIVIGLTFRYLILRSFFMMSFTSVAFASISQLLFNFFCDNATESMNQFYQHISKMADLIFDLCFSLSTFSLMSSQMNLGFLLVLLSILLTQDYVTLYSLATSS